MKIHESISETCSECNRFKREISPDVYGCDNCRKEIQHELDAGKRQHLQMTVFRNPDSSSSEHLEFCSWKCVLAYLPKVKSNYFVTLPYLHFDGGYPKEMTGKEFVRLVARKRK